MKIVLFEDERISDLYPIVYVRAAFDLRCGIFTLKEKIEKKFAGTKVYLETRDLLDAVTVERHGAEMVNSEDAVKADDDILLVNAGAILTAEADTYSAKEQVGVTDDGAVVWAFLSKDTVARLGTPAALGLAQDAAKELPLTETDDILIRYPWDTIVHNPDQITADYKAYYTPERKSTPLQGAAAMGPAEDLWIGENVVIQPHTWLDHRDGPIILSDGCKITAHTSIQGPAFIGPDTYIFEGKIREGTTIGPVCRIAGEIEECIIHGYSNKAHIGFLGHAYVCEWVNLGALTTNSDLKNDYSNVKLMVDGESIDSGSMKVGSFIGDHTKTSIGTLLNTGSMVGMMCNLMAGSSVLPKFMPSFAWYMNDKVSKGLGVEYGLGTARAAMGRRKVELTNAMADLIRETCEMTKEVRTAIVRKDRKKKR